MIDESTEVAAPAASTPEELQEVLSVTYVHAARIIGPLASGRFAVAAMARGRIIGMLTSEEVHPLIQQAAAESIQQHELSRRQELEERERPRRPPPTAVVVGANAEDLGL